MSIDNQTNTFKLLRNREDKIATYTMDANNEVSVLLDNQMVQDSMTIQRYMLHKTRVKSYQNFYQMMLGLPMSLNEKSVAEFDAVSSTVFNDKDAYAIDIRLKKPIFSTTWKVYVSTIDFSLLGVEIISEESPSDGERLFFDKTVRIGNIEIPRIRHWYDLEDVYGGSDVIVSVLEN